MNEPEKPMHHDPTRDDPTTELLQRALAEEAEMVQTDPNALNHIRQRTGRSSQRRHTGWVLGTVGAGVAAAAVIVAAVFLAGGNDDEGGTIADSPSQEPAQGDLTFTFPVTYLGPADNDWRLVTELHTIEASNAPHVDAVREFLTGEPADPDYQTGWPSQLDVENVTHADGEVQVALTGPPGALQGDQGLPAEARALAVQALLRTDGASVGDKATFTYNGDPVSSVLGVDLPVTVAPDEDTRAYISLPGIVDGHPYADAHDGAPVKAEVVGNVFEGTVNWELFDANATKIDEGFVTTAFMEWRSATINMGPLEPGTYTLKVFEVSMEDGSRLFTEDKTFEVVP